VIEDKTKNKRWVYGLSSFLSLMLGMCIYLLFRDMSNMILFAWLPEFEFTKTVFVSLKPSVISSLLQFNVPDMLWFVSGILLLRFIWFGRPKEQKVYISCFYGIGAIFEISQLSKRVPGTFDLLDLLFMGIGAFVEGLLYNQFIRRRLK
jgi:hypothetical protein